MQVADHGSATLAVLIIIYGMAKDFRLIRKICIDGDFGVASTVDEPVLRRGVSRLFIQDVIIGSNVAGRLRRIQPVDGRDKISILPARREVGVKVGRRWLEEQSSIDSARPTDGATNKSVHLVGATRQIGRPGEDGIVEPRYVDTAQIRADQPLWSLGASGDAVRWPTSFQEKDFLCPALTQPAGNDYSRGTRTDHNHIPNSRGP